MTAATLFNYDADARDRLRELLDRRNVGFLDRLKLSIDSAGACLELCKPGAMGSSIDDTRHLYAGPVVMVAPGTVLIVLAHRRKVFSLWLRSDTCTLTEAIEGCVQHVEESVKEGDLAKEMLVSVITDLIEKHGRRPEKKGPELPQQQHADIIGLLFAVMSKAERARVITGLEMIIAEDVCPAMVGLLGKGSTKGTCGAWPLLLPLAPYADAVLA